MHAVQCIAWWTSAANPTTPTTLTTPTAAQNRERITQTDCRALQLEHCSTASNHNRRTGAGNITIKTEADE
jgi:hypothetical protein